jgi:hypothetical protein
MGSTPSKPLLEWTSQELGLALEGLGGAGSKYVAYIPTILDNGVDGALLYDFSDQEFAETLTDLNITNRLHCRVLTKEWNQQLKKEEQKQSSSSSQRIPSTAASASSSPSLWTIPTATTTTSVPMVVIEDDDDSDLSMDRPSNNDNTTILSDLAPTDTPSDHQSHPIPPTTTTSKRRSNVSFQLDSITTTNDWAAAFKSNHHSHGSTNEDHHNSNNSNNRNHTTINHQHHHHPYGESYSGPSTTTTFQTKRGSISDQLLRLHQSDTSLYTGVQLLDPDGHMSLSSIYKPKDPFFIQRSHNKANRRRPRPPVQEQQVQEQQVQAQAQQIWTNHLFAAETETQVRLKEVLQQRNLVLASQIQKAKP